jgi:hypothetical protein
MIDKEILKLPILFRIYFRKVNADITAKQAYGMKWKYAPF